MRSPDEHKGPLQPPDYRELRLLSEIEANPEVAQRQLSTRLGIALGLTNVLLRNLAQKGYLRATQASWKRWLYALTPDGFSQKIRLTVAYVNRVLDHYRSVRQTLREQLKPIAMHEESRIAIYGTGEFAELVYLGLKELKIEEIDFFGPNGPDARGFLGMPVRELSTLIPEEYDQVIIAELTDWEATVDELQEKGATSDKLVIFFADGRTREVA